MSTLRDELLALVTEVESKEADIEQRMKELSEAIVRLRMVAERVQAEEVITISGCPEVRVKIPDSYLQRWRP